MSVEHSHHLENPNATTPPPKIDLISSVPAPPIPDNAEAMTIAATGRSPDGPNSCDSLEFHDVRVQPPASRVP